MADQFNIEDIIAREGRFSARAADRWPTTIVATINFETLYGQISAYTFSALRNYEPFRRQYTGTAQEIDNLITHEIDHLSHQALNELWNRLRIISETYHPTTRNGVFARKAPTYEGLVLPRFFASMLSSIGPLRISDTFRESYVIYAPAATTATTFGRAALTAVDPLAIHHIQRAFREIHLPTASIQGRGSIGSFFTTAFTRFVEDDRFEVVGYFHPSHYTRTDIIMAILLSDPIEDENPYEDLSLSVGFISDEATVAAFRAVAPPDAHQAVDGASRHVAATYEINRFGLAPARDIPVNGRGEGFYVLGRGSGREQLCSLARDLTENEMNLLIRYRILYDAPQAPALPQNVVGANPPPPPGP